MERIEVAAGVLFRSGKLLITKRKKGSHLGGYWEFPGGKRERGETFQQCLQRELKEEIGVEVTVDECLHVKSHQYPEKLVYIEFFLCLAAKGDPHPLDCQEIKWIKKKELNKYEFPEADLELLQILAVRPKLWSPSGN